MRHTMKKRMLLLFACVLTLALLAAPAAAAQVRITGTEGAVTGTLEGQQAGSLLFVAAYRENGQMLWVSMPETAEEWSAAAETADAAFVRAFVTDGNGVPDAPEAQQTENAVCSVDGNTYASLEDALSAARARSSVITWENGDARPGDDGLTHFVCPQIDIFGEVGYSGLLTLESGIVLNVKEGGSLTADAVELQRGHYADDTPDNAMIVVETGGALTLGGVPYAGEGGLVDTGDDGAFALIGQVWDPGRPEQPEFGAPELVMKGRLAIHGDAELVGISTLLIRAGAELNAEGDLTLGDGMTFILQSESGENGTTGSRLNVQGDLALTGTAVVWERTEITVGGDLRLTDGNWYGLLEYYDEETGEYREGPHVAVTGNLVMGEGTELMLSPHWGEGGFEGYGAHLTAANVAQTAEEAAEMLQRGGTVYLLQTACGRVDGLTVSQSAELLRLDGGAVLEVGSLTVEEGQTLTVGEEIEVAADELHVEGEIRAYGNLRMDDFSVFGGGTLWQGRSYADFARMVWANYGDCFTMREEDWDASALFDNEEDVWQRLNDEGDREALSGFAVLRAHGILEDGSLRDPWQRMPQDAMLALLEKLAPALGLAELPETVGNELTPGELLYAGHVEERYDGEGNPEGRFVFGQYEAACDRLYERLSTVEVTNEQELRDALNAPLGRFIHVTADTEITSELSVSAGNGDRHVYVEPGVTLTVAEGTSLNIESGTELVVLWDEEGQTHGTLRILGTVHRMGGLDPDWDGDERLEFGENGGIVRFCDTMEFCKRVWERTGALVEAPTQEEKDALAALGRMDWPEWDDRLDAFVCAIRYLGEEKLGLVSDDERWRPYDTVRYGTVYEILGAYYAAIFPENGDWETVLPALIAEADVDPEAQDDWGMPDDQVEKLLTAFSLLLPREEAEEHEFTVERSPDGMETVNGREDTTLRGPRFAEEVQIFTGNRADPSGEYDDYAGEIRFENCEFGQGIRIFTEPGLHYSVRFTGCEGGAIFIELPEGVENGADCPDRTGIELRGGLNGLTVFTDGAPLHLNEMTPGAFTLDELTFETESRDYDLDARWDDWGWDDETQQPTGKIRTYELHNRDMEHPASVSGTFDGKLRVFGSVDLSGVSFTGEGLAELAEDFDEEGNPRPSEIEVGANRIRIGDDYRSDCAVTARDGGGIHAETLREASVRLNGVPVGGAHIFGRDGFGVFLPWGGLPADTFGTLWQDTSEGLRELEYSAEFIDEDGDGASDKLHLGQKSGSPWITDPGAVRLEITVSGAVFTSERLWWKDAPSGADAFSLEEMKELLTGDTEEIHLPVPVEGIGGTLTVPEGRTLFVHSELTAEEGETLEIRGSVRVEGSLVSNGDLIIDPTDGEQMFVQLVVQEGGSVTVNGTLRTVTILQEDAPTLFGEILVSGGRLDLSGVTSCAEGSSVCWEGGEIVLPEGGVPAGLEVSAILFGGPECDRLLAGVLADPMFVTVFLNGETRLTQDVTVPEGVTLFVGAPVTLAPGVEVTEYGTIIGRENLIPEE